MRKIIWYILPCCFAAFNKIAAQDSMAVRMANTVMTIWKDSLYTDPSKPARWSYDQGVILKGMEGLWVQTGDPVYFRYMQQSMDFFVDEKGQIRTYKASDQNLDNLLCGNVLLRLYQVTGKHKYLAAAQQLYAQLQTQPRTPTGGFWHKKIYPNQMWLDGLYMAEPFYAMYSALFHVSANWKDIAYQFILAEQHTRDPESGLLYHAWDAAKEQAWADKQTGRSPHSWARAMGWYGLALTEVLEYFPEHLPERDSLLAILQRYAATVAKYQQSSGLWYDVLDMPREKGNYFESSAACMF
ncbi:MAG TPA: glycoside hydrolase family 88 protein, partial [Sediminibacterium sp.]|nr:glycoside hydrolase family 88 protein [Sediminibacterium sp.]